MLRRTRWALLAPLQIVCLDEIFVALQNTAQSYIGQWQHLSISQDKTRILTSFGSDTSAGVMYNLYADKLLQLDLVPQSASIFSLILLSSE